VVLAESGRVLTARKYPRLLALRGSLDSLARPTINGLPWDSEEAGKLVQAAVGRPASLALVPGPERFDVLPLLIATDGAVSFMGFDRRRLRPNIVVSGVDGLAERQWPGAVIAIGEVRIHAERLRPRCVMTTYDPDTQVQDLGVLRGIVEKLDGTMALDCKVLSAGTIRVGDEVEISTTMGVASGEARAGAPGEGACATRGKYLSG
jgi:hypothetical protein